MLTLFCVVVISILIAAVILLLNSNFNYREKNKEFINKYEKISSLKKAEEELSEKIKRDENEYSNKINNVQEKAQRLSSEYSLKKQELDSLIKRHLNLTKFTIVVDTNFVCAPSSSFNLFQCLLITINAHTSGGLALSFQSCSTC